MIRIKRTNRQQPFQQILKIKKFIGSKSRRIRKQFLLKSFCYGFLSRKKKKSSFKQIYLTRINQQLFDSLKFATMSKLRLYAKLCFCSLNCYWFSELQFLNLKYLNIVL